jgi:hypothetical protein
VLPHAEDQPAVDPELSTQELDVLDQVGCGVGLEVGGGVGGVRPAPLTVALIEQHEAVRARIEESPMPRRAARARAAVQHHGRLPTWVAAGLPVEGISVAHVQHAVGVRLDLWIHAGHLMVRVKVEARRLWSKKKGDHLVALHICASRSDSAAKAAVRAYRSWSRTRSPPSPSWGICRRTTKRGPPPGPASILP